MRMMVRVQMKRLNVDFVVVSDYVLLHLLAHLFYFVFQLFKVLFKEEWLEELLSGIGLIWLFF